MSLEGMEAVFVKSELEWEGEGACGVSEATARVEGGSFIEIEVKLEQDWENESRAGGVSKAAAEVGLCKDHPVKDELVLGPVSLQPSDVVFPFQASLEQVKKTEGDQETLLDSTCSINLEPMFVDTDHLTCHVGFQTYKLRLCPQGPLPLVQDENETNAMKSMSISQMRHQDVRTEGTNKSLLCVKDSLKNNSKTDTAEEQEASVSSQNNSKADLAGKKTYKCTHCSYTSVRRARLRIHERIHTGEKPYKCGHCSYASAYKGSLIRHETSHTGKKRYKCIHCSYASAHKSHLIDHERKHTGEKPFKCGQCSYASAYKSHLLVHERIHTGDKPFKCGYCSYAGVHKSALLLHETKHTGEKPYKCGQCNYASARKVDVLSHEKSIHAGEKPFKCIHCSYASAHKSHFLAHERTHTGENPYKCSHCNYSSAHKKCLRDHERVHTGAEPDHVNNK